MKFRTTAIGIAIMVAGIYLIMTISVEAGTFTTNGLISDTDIGMNTSTNPIVLWSGGADLYCGGNNPTYNKGDECSVLVFQLPDLGGGSISSANLDFDGYRSHESVWNIDLYAVRSSSSSSAVNVSDYGFGPSPTGTLVQDNIMSPSDVNITWFSKSTDATGDVNLANWLTAQYTAVGVGGYVFLRFNPDNTIAQLTGDGSVYMISSANATVRAKPTLTITTLSGTKGFEIITK